MPEKTKRNRCRFCFPEIHANQIKYNCIYDGSEQPVTEETCDTCDRFSSRYIEYPITVHGIKNAPIHTDGGYPCGTLCEVTLAEDTKKSYLGLYIGNLPHAIQTSFDPKTGTLSNNAVTNPAIYVFELKRIVYGYESWWRTIESVKDFKGISEKDIENTWYVRLLKTLEQDKK